MNSTGQRIHPLLNLCVLSVFAFFCVKCRSDEDAKRVTSVNEDNKTLKITREAANDIALAEWFTDQAFAFQVVSSKANDGEVRIPFSLMDTPAEDVVHIQLKSIRDFLNRKDKEVDLTEVGLWFETQLKAENVLIGFVKSHYSGQLEIEKITDTEEYHTNVLTRQYNLLKFIRDKRHGGNIGE